MTRRRVLLAAAALLALGALLALLFPRLTSENARELVPSPTAPAPDPAFAAAPRPSAIVNRKSEIADFPLAAALHPPGADVHADLRAVSALLDAFRTNFPREGNPVGDNAEITAALTGRNRLQLALVPPGHPAINAAGELCDRWGTPYFFHAEGATKMEIRSAGPDRRLWTADDALLAP